MTYVKSPVVEIACDSNKHQGPNVFVVQYGTALTAQESLRRLGWRRGVSPKAHLCPACASRAARQS